MKKISIMMMLFFSSFSYAALLGDSGNERCGVGSMIFKNGQSICSQVSENSTNQFFGETFSVTTGTSGCSNSGLTSVPQEELLYVNANYEDLLLEMSQGQGEVLEGLAATMGCAGISSAEFGAFSKSNFQSIKTNKNMQPNEFLIRFRDAARTNTKLNQSCRSMRG